MKNLIMIFAILAMSGVGIANAQVLEDPCSEQCEDETYYA
ncbi:hypothetical protein SAMN04487988_11170 [Algoriphagus hitonicola]|uniref:Uncharacterized protein n=1 Tax=Algoriphagus hitonicola TaxID=435880 RepID=A0A1I2W060_9BACT|nr:hypothetical protein SAMN04487988_11170 [Algoriphagus hitonicola]